MFVITMFPVSFLPTAPSGWGKTASDGLGNLRNKRKIDWVIFDNLAFQSLFPLSQYFQRGVLE